LIDWAHWGIDIESKKEGDRSASASFRERLYREEIWRKLSITTMALHWDDYAERRRGRWPAFLQKFHPEKIGKELQEMGRLMNWDANRIPAEQPA